MVTRFDVFLVNLDREPSADAKNTRPCIIISPDEMNRNIQNVIVAPLSSSTAKYPTRISVDFLNGERGVILDQIRTVDRTRLVKKIGKIDQKSQNKILDKLRELFAE